jgi:enamine deaminase RidA (YjgF/YER057c/UK114 family)
MIKALSLAAALAVLPLSAALAADPQTAQGASSDAAEAAIEAAAERFEARMEAFGERADAIAADQTLTETQRKMRVAELWAQYEPDVTAFTATVSEHAGAIAAAALAEIDVEALVSEAMASVDLSGAMQAAQGVAANGAWASNDPEHMTTYSLMADYAVGEALDAVEEATGKPVDLGVDLDMDMDIDVTEAAKPAPSSAR